MRTPQHYTRLNMSAKITKYLKILRKYAKNEKYTVTPSDKGMGLCLVPKTWHTTAHSNYFSNNKAFITR